MAYDFESKVQQLLDNFKELSGEEIERAVDHAKSLMDFDTRREFEDLYQVAMARMDRKASIEYWYRDNEGKKIKLTQIQELMLDFVEMVWSLGMMPIVNLPMGLGKTTLACAILANEIGRNQNIRTQIVCAAEDTAIARGRSIGSILLSRDFRKVFPHIKKADKRPWNDHKLNVSRTIFDPEAEEMERLAGLEPGTIDSTLAAYGIDSKALGARVDLALFDDIPNEDNAINSPQEGDKVASKLDSTWLSRKESPVGVDNQDYDVTKDPYKVLFINTPWAENDCTFRRIKLPRYVTLLAGVNADFTGYNVEIWNLPDHLCDLLRKKYELVINEKDLADDKMEVFSRKDYKIGDIVPSYPVYKDFPAKITFTIRLSRPAEWYINEYKGNAKFNQMYRCMVVSDQEKAFPMFDRCLNQDLKVKWNDIYGHNDDGKKIIKGSRAYVTNMPKGHPMYAAVDLSGAQRQGTVLTCGYLLPDYRRMPVEIRKGGWTGDEISDQIGELFTEYPDLHTVFVENAGQQDIFIKEMLKHKDKYPWWMKIQVFKTSAKSKNDKLLGVLAMDTAFTNHGFVIANTPLQDNHPPLGDGRYPEGCPCGFCNLIRDAHNQLRMAKVASDSLMSLWMYHSSLPQMMTLPTAGAPDGMIVSQDGTSFAQSFEESFSEGAGFLASLFEDGSDDRTNDFRLVKHYREDGSEINELDSDWEDRWSDMYEDMTDKQKAEIESSEVDFNQPAYLRQEVNNRKKVNKWSKTTW